MLISKRNKKIIKEYKDGKGKVRYSDLAEEYGVTKSRIGQIILEKNHKVFICKRHSRKYRTECPDCKISGYYLNVLDNNGDIRKEIEMLKNADRSLRNVRKKKILITKLRDEFEFSFLRIGVLLKMHYSSVSYLYHNYKKE